MHQTVSPVAKRMEQAVLGVDDIADLLPRGSSALVLAAAPDVCARAIEMFSPWKPKVLRRDVGIEVIRDLLEGLHRLEMETIDESAAQ
ncbi:MAG: hypothetical protein ABSC94_24195 [Polyangiaceae bacterium]